MRTHLRTTSSEQGTPPGERGAPQSVGRVFSILDTLVGARGGATLSELAVRAGAPKTSLVGLLAGLAAEGCVQRGAAGRYPPRPRLLAPAGRGGSRREIIDLARPILAEMAAASGETAVLGALAPDADMAIYLDRVESANPIRYAVTIGERRELHCAAVGEVLLPYPDERHVERYLDSTPRRRFTAATVTGRSRLLADIAAIRRDGMARTADERVHGASGIATPVLGADGRLVAVLSIAGPSERMRAHAARNEDVLRRATARCAALVGGIVAGAGGDNAPATPYRRKSRR